MAWAHVAAFVLIGAVLGFAIARLTTKTTKQADVKAELDKAKEELTQQRQELVEHFSNSAELLENIYRDYSKLCQIMAKTSTDLLPEQEKQDNPFAKRLAHTLEITPEKEPIELQEAPRDYSETSSGLLKDVNEAQSETQVKKETKTKEKIEPALSKEENKEVAEKVE